MSKNSICILQNTHFQFSDSWLSPRLSHSRLLPRLSKEYKIQQQQTSSVLFDTTTLWTTQKFILAPIFYIHQNSSHIPIGSLFFEACGCQLTCTANPVTFYNPGGTRRIGPPLFRIREFVRKSVVLGSDFV